METETIEIKPVLENTLRFLAKSYIDHGFVRGYSEAMASILEHVRYLYITNPEELQRIIDELNAK